MKLIRTLPLFLLALLAGRAEAKLRIVSTTQDPAALAMAVGGDRVEVKALARGFQDPHYLDAKPTYMVELHRADLVLCIGLDLEIGYLPSLIAGAHNDAIRPGTKGYLDLSTLVSPLEVIPLADRSQGDIHPNGNPHYWLDPENGRKLARGIAARLGELDPEGRATYAANLAAFERRLTEKEAAWAKAMAPLKGKPVITFHRSWTYFAKVYGLDVVGFVEPKPGIPPTPAHTLETIKLALAKDVKVLLEENFYDARAAKLIASKTHARLAVVPNSVNGTDAAKGYLELFDVIVGEVTRAYGGAQ